MSRAQGLGLRAEWGSLPLPLVPPPSPQPLALSPFDDLRRHLGYNYPEWKGSFYPADLAAAKMLPYYAARFPTVEINYTFYRMPTEKLLAGWIKQVPPAFRFTLKAPGGLRTTRSS
jgi:hypothetical protein